MGRFDITVRDEDAVAAWLRQPEMLGIRLTLHPFIRALCEAFGPRRLFWGSDLTRLPCSYRLAVNPFTEEFKWLTASDLEWIMGRALCEWSHRPTGS